jgi:voltage-gated potassium channel
MSFSPTRFINLTRERMGAQNFRFLMRFILALFLIVATETLLFHALMLREGQNHSLFSGLYWTLVTMSTLGYGDIYFQTDLGRLFSLTVLLSGMIFLLILLPFTFIEFIYEPLRKAQSDARAPRSLSAEHRDHVILTNYDEVTYNLIHRLKQYHYDYVVIIQDLEQALRLHDQGFNVMVGAPDDPDSYVRARIDQAALVASTATDMQNTSVTFTVREKSESVPIISSANSPLSVDILYLAGATHVLQLGERMGQFLGRLATGGDGMSHKIGQFEQLLFSEGSIMGTPLAGKSLRESRLREISGVTVVGIWHRGRFETVSPDTILKEHMVLVIMGTQDQMKMYDELFAIYHNSTAPVVIIGGGRVGRAAGRTLEERGLDYRIVEQRSDRSGLSDKYVHGDAADYSVLEAAGIMESPAVIITSHEDDTNVYLTLYCRRLRPDIQIISRSKLERNVESLHRAGADFVMSYASMGGNAIFNLLKRTDVLLISEGLHLFRIKLPVKLAGRTIADTSVQQDSGCYITAIFANNTMHINPEPSMRLPAESEIILIGSVESEQKFLELYGN